MPTPAQTGPHPQAHPQEQPYPHGQWQQAPSPYQFVPAPGAHPYPGAAASITSQSLAFSIGAMVMGCIALLFFPILFGPAGIGLAIAALVRKERWGVAAMCIAGAGTVLGMVLGILSVTGL